MPDGHKISAGGVWCKYGSEARIRNRPEEGFRVEPAEPRTLRVCLGWRPQLLRSRFRACGLCAA